MKKESTESIQRFITGYAAKAQKESINTRVKEAQLKRAAAEQMVLDSNDVQEMLLISKSRLNALVDEGKLKTLKSVNRGYIFWQPDVEAFKQELLLDSRSNIYKAMKRGDADK